MAQDVASTVCLKHNVHVVVMRCRKGGLIAVLKVSCIFCVCVAVEQTVLLLRA